MPVPISTLSRDNRTCPGVPWGAELPQMENYWLGPVFFVRDFIGPYLEHPHLFGRDEPGWEGAGGGYVNSGEQKT